MAGQNNSKKDPEEIRREIQATRSRMTGTIDSLENRLDPQRLKDDATSAIRDNTVGRVERFTGNATETVKGAGADVFETIKENPLPAMLAAIGIGWLFMERKNDSRKLPSSRYSDAGRYSRYDRYDPYYGSRYQPSRANVYGESEGMSDRMRGTADRIQDRGQEMAGQVQDKAQQVAGQVQDTAQQVTGQVQDTARQVADQAQQVAGQAQEQVSEWADAAQEQAYRMRSRFEEMFDENPLLIGAAAAAIGAAIGLSLPTTQKEDQLFGSVRDDVMDKAQSKAQDTMQKVQTVAQKAGDAAKEAAKDEAQKQNLPAGS